MGSGAGRTMRSHVMQMVGMIPRDDMCVTDIGCLAHFVRTAKNKGGMSRAAISAITDAFNRTLQLRCHSVQAPVNADPQEELV